MFISVRLFFILLLSNLALIATIVGSKHDLSATNFYGPYPGASEEVCVFCHTPHGSNSNLEILWNRNVTDTAVFTLYSGVQGVPNNPSILCLSCHDGVSAEGEESAVNADDTHNVINSPGAGHEINPATPNCNACHLNDDDDMYPVREWRIGPDLTDDHPISVSYENARNNDPVSFQLNPLNGLKLVDGNVECTTCHDPHNVDLPSFLRVSNQNSYLCQSCHIK